MTSGVTPYLLFASCTPSLRYCRLYSTSNTPSRWCIGYTVNSYITSKGYLQCSKVLFYLQYFPYHGSIYYFPVSLLYLQRFLQPLYLQCFPCSTCKILFYLQSFPYPCSIYSVPHISALFSVSCIPALFTVLLVSSLYLQCFPYLCSIYSVSHTLVLFTVFPISLLYLQCVPFSTCKVCLLLFYALATVFQLYYGGDMIWDEKEKAPADTFTDSRDL